MDALVQRTAMLRTRYSMNLFRSLAKKGPRGRAGPRFALAGAVDWSCRLREQARPAFIPWARRCGDGGQKRRMRRPGAPGRNPLPAGGAASSETGQAAARDRSRHLTGEKAIVRTRRLPYRCDSSFPGKVGRAVHQVANLTFGGADLRWHTTHTARNYGPPNLFRSC